MGGVVNQSLSVFVSMVNQLHMLFSVDFCRFCVSCGLSYLITDTSNQNSAVQPIAEVLVRRGNLQAGDRHWRLGILEGQQWIVTVSCRLITLV